ncbi:hypothetical protein RFN29_27865 [Mesorhizobium sp. VK22B]|uniref:Uncharacterized protein n=1 Tax=Mesorhizobium captivum TaxID=3072319 RepID=A0ABU4Z8Z2_9HYPH|nr:hypothetical protein [Mesorhizobium sp. VK22B]MDX8495381.1 hypothetical protein [Mesorhizobium sp. VK22B]
MAVADRGQVKRKRMADTPVKQVEDVAAVRAERACRESRQDRELALQRAAAENLDVERAGEASGRGEEAREAIVDGQAEAPRVEGRFMQDHDDVRQGIAWRLLRRRRRQQWRWLGVDVDKGRPPRRSGPNREATKAERWARSCVSNWNLKRDVPPLERKVIRYRHAAAANTSMRIGSGVAGSSSIMSMVTVNAATAAMPKRAGTTILA